MPPKALNLEKLKNDLREKRTDIDKIVIEMHEINNALMGKEPKDKIAKEKWKSELVSKKNVLNNDITRLEEEIKKIAESKVVKSQKTNAKTKSKQKFL